MQCITCNKEIPDASTVCPFCNNKVEPAVSASQALGVSEPSVVPTTPTEYKLPKDQMNATAATPVVDPNMPVNTTDIMPPPPPTIEEEKVEEQPEEQPVETAESVGTITQSNTVDVSSINIENLDLNANAQAKSLDLTKETLNDKISNEAVPTKKKKITKKTIILTVVALVVIGLGVLGFMFYNKEYKSSKDRIKNSVNKLFSFTSRIKTDDYIKSSGTYELSYSHGNDTDKVNIELDGKYGYDIKNKKIDLIANIKKYENNDVNIDTELNTEIYLDSERVYFLLQNFNDNYIHMDIKDTSSVIKDVESRFNNPEELFLFKNVNYLFDNYLNVFTTKYSTYINNAASNDVNYTNIMNGLKLAITNALISMPSTQKIEGGENIVRINLNNADKVKKLINGINENLHNNASANGELVKIFGDDFYTYFKEIIDKYEFKPINGDIIFATDLFKGNLKYVIVPTLKGDKVVNTKIVPLANGYNIISTMDNVEILNIQYNRSSSSTSTVNTTVYKITGKTNLDGNNKELNITLKIGKDVTPQEVVVVTRNTLDYKYLTSTDYALIAEKISNTPGIGEIFKSIYKGTVVEDDSFETENPQEGA